MWDGSSGCTHSLVPRRTLGLWGVEQEPELSLSASVGKGAYLVCCRLAICVLLMVQNPCSLGKDRTGGLRFHGAGQGCGIHCCHHRSCYCSSPEQLLGPGGAPGFFPLGFRATNDSAWGYFCLRRPYGMPGVEPR